MRAVITKSAFNERGSCRVGNEVYTLQRSAQMMRTEPILHAQEAGFCETKRTFYCSHSEKIETSMPTAILFLSSLSRWISSVVEQVQIHVRSSTTPVDQEIKHNISNIFYIETSFLRCAAFAVQIQFQIKTSAGTGKFMKLIS